MPITDFQELLDAGVHFGHLKRKWNPNMAPYIFMERNGIHIIDLQKTSVKLEEACNALKQISKSGRKILFVATKKQAKDLVGERIQKTGMPFVTERWPGGMLTNFPTIRKAIKKMTSIDKMATDGTFDNLSKRERLQITRQRAKLEKNLGSISDLTRLPAALFIVDVTKEYIAVREARRLNIPVFAMVDTNSNPDDIDFPIPANDDASKSIALIIDKVAAAIEEGLNERKLEKEKEGPVKEKEPKQKGARKGAAKAKAESTQKEAAKEPAKAKAKEKDEEQPVKPSPEKEPAVMEASDEDIKTESKEFDVDEKNAEEEKADEKQERGGTINK
jgi:small subunit ribosomal protein S2